MELNPTKLTTYLIFDANALIIFGNKDMLECLTKIFKDCNFATTTAIYIEIQRKVDACSKTVKKLIETGILRVIDIEINSPDAIRIATDIVFSSRRPIEKQRKLDQAKPDATLIILAKNLQTSDPSGKSARVFIVSEDGTCRDVARKEGCAPLTPRGLIHWGRENGYLTSTEELKIINSMNISGGGDGQ